MNVGDRRLARLLNAFPEIVVVLDGSGNVLWANQLRRRTLRPTPGVAPSACPVSTSSTPTTWRSCCAPSKRCSPRASAAPSEIRAKIGDDWRLIELIGTPVPLVREGSRALQHSRPHGPTAIRVGPRQRRPFPLAGAQRHDDHDAHLPRRATSSPSPGAMTRMLGHDPEVVEGQPLANIVATSDRPAFAWRSRTPCAAPARPNPSCRRCDCCVAGARR